MGIFSRFGGHRETVEERVERVAEEATGHRVDYVEVDDITGEPVAVVLDNGETLTPEEAGWCADGYSDYGEIDQNNAERGPQGPQGAHHETVSLDGVRPGERSH